MFTQLQDIFSCIDSCSVQDQLSEKESQKSYGFYSAKTDTFYELNEETYIQAMQYFKNCVRPQISEINLDNDSNNSRLPFRETSCEDILDSYDEIYMSLPPAVQKIELQQIDF